MGKETKKSSAQLEIGTSEWEAARTREGAEEARKKAAEKAERDKLEAIKVAEEAARKARESKDGLMDDEMKERLANAPSEGRKKV
ncbi:MULTISPECIES: hypothetical protein [Xanthomonas]|uniref:hypothetical protein n=1 Tax=Xanthomonas TaxID=338 RepID=UPI000375191B|nr:MULTISPECIES: hypothetical protein [Xanthomonas]MCC4605812.1 hypothetical protein [Xanthomonas campestris pv. parthenii]